MSLVRAIYSFFVLVFFFLFIFYYYFLINVEKKSCDHLKQVKL